MGRAFYRHRSSFGSYIFNSELSRCNKGGLLISFTNLTGTQEVIQALKLASIRRIHRNRLSLLKTAENSRKQQPHQTHSATQLGILHTQSVVPNRPFQESANFAKSAAKPGFQRHLGAGWGKLPAARGCRPYVYRRNQVKHFASISRETPLPLTLDNSLTPARTGCSWLAECRLLYFLQNLGSRWLRNLMFFNPASRRLPKRLGPPWSSA